MLRPGNGERRHPAVTKQAAQQIVGRERRERLSQLVWCGGGCFDSRRRVNSSVRPYVTSRIMWTSPQTALAHTLRWAVGILSTLLILFYYFVLAAVLPWEPSSLGQLLLAYPLLYFAYCILSCFGVLRGRALVVSGTIANVGLVPLIIWLLMNKGALVAVLFSAFALLWCWMCVARLADDADRALKQMRAEQIVGGERRERVS